MNVIGAWILFILIVVVLLAPRRMAVLGMIAGVLYLTQGEQIQVLGLNLFAIRLLEMAGFARVMARREFTFSKLNKIDRAFLWFYIYITVVFLLRSTEGQVYQIGIAVDATLCYFTFRGLTGSIEDFRWFLRSFVILLAPYLILVSIESQTAHNFFSIVGNPSDSVLFREGKPRCIGSFRHPILMGTLGASFLPLYIGMAAAKADLARALVGIGLCLGIVFLSNSGGPLNTAAVGLVGWLLWFARKRMFLVRRIIVGFIILMALVMKSPIWYLPAKVSSLSGGGGWHRSYLLDVAIRNIDKWWLSGMSTMQTKDWFPYTLVSGTADITNQFLAFGITAGLGGIALFILLLTRSFQSLGEALTVVRSNFQKTTEAEFMLWGLGVMLSAHVVNWFGVCYFDHFYVVWFMQLAAISNLSFSTWVLDLVAGTKRSDDLLLIHKTTTSSGGPG